MPQRNRTPKIQKLEQKIQERYLEIRENPHMAAFEAAKQEMDAMTVLLMTDNGYFLLPGGTPISANCSLPVPWPAVPNAVCGHSIAKTL